MFPQGTHYSLHCGPGSLTQPGYCVVFPGPWHFVLHIVPLCSGPRPRCLASARLLFRHPPVNSFIPSWCHNTHGWFFFKIYFVFIYVSVCARPTGARRGCLIPAAEVTGGRELPNLGARTHANLLQQQQTPCLSHHVLIPAPHLGFLAETPCLSAFTLPPPSAALCIPLIRDFHC